MHAAHSSPRTAVFPALIGYTHRNDDHPVASAPHPRMKSRARLTAAVLWGTLAVSSLVLGALLGLARERHEGLIGVVLEFGARALISSMPLFVDLSAAVPAIRFGCGMWPAAVSSAPRRHSRIRSAHQYRSASPYEPA
jgi:hypothetical protein